MPSPEVASIINQNSLSLAPGQSAQLEPLVGHLSDNIRSKAARLAGDGKTFEVLTPEWCRENPAEAGRMHAEVIVGTYGSTYALPNKDPEANRAAIEGGDLDVYLMNVNGELTGTTCMVNLGDGRAELGRSASVGRSGNSIIQDLRILDWLTNPEAAAKYHTIVTTLRTAPDRTIDEASGFVMRGGQAVTAHWRKFPSLKVNGAAPLYFKHGMLEQFTCASITRNRLDPNCQLYVSDPTDMALIAGWHKQYNLPRPQAGSGDGEVSVRFEAHYPPVESGLNHLVHADIAAANDGSGASLEDCLVEVDEGESPFTQVILPIDHDTIAFQAMLRQAGFQVFGYQPTDEKSAGALLFGRVRPGVEVVPTHWSHNQTEHPFWQDPALQQAAETIARRW